MFFGAGGIYFNKPPARHNVCNDFDADVYNLYQVIQQQPEKLYQAVEAMPIHEALLRYWATTTEADPIRKALRFLLRSNFGYMGKPETMVFGEANTKKLILQRIDLCFKKCQNVQFTCCDFRDVLPKLHIRRADGSVFVYADPPYLGTTHTYESGFTPADTRDLFALLAGSNYQFAISEFNTEFTLELAKEHRLIVTDIGERPNLKNRENEVLITNYSPTLKTYHLF